LIHQIGPIGSMVLELAYANMGTTMWEAR